MDRNALLLVALLALTLSPALRADNVQTLPVASASEVTIKVSTPAMSVPRFGFAPMRVTIENTANQERTWRAAFQVGMRGQFPGLSTTTREFTVPAGQTRETWVFVPIAEPSVNAGNVVAASPTSLPPGGIVRSGRGGMPTVTITRTPVGAKVSVARGSGSGAYTTEQEIDATTGAVSATWSGSGGRPPATRPPVPPGNEATISIDELFGNIRTTTRPLADRTAPPKIVIVATPPPGSGTGPTLVSSGGSVGGAAPPIVMSGPASASLIVAEFAGPGVTNANRLQFSSPPNVPMRPFAVSSSLESPVRSQLGAVVRGASNLSVVEAAQLPADWRVWSSFAAVLLTVDEFASLDAGRRAALRGWVGLGGRLWLSPAAAGAERVEHLGAGRITTLAEPLPDGSGLNTLDQRTIDRWVTKLEIYSTTAGLPGINDLLLEKTPIGEAVQERTTRASWFAVFLIVFAVIVGPVNLFVFAPPAKRYRLFLTTPLIALVASLFLGVAIVLQDGLGGDGARRALVVLLPGENQAAVFQEQASVAGFLSRRTFALGDDTQLSVLPLESSAIAQQFSAANNVELTREPGRAGGDWFRSRARQAQLVQRLVPTRGRIERAGTAPDGAPIVQSSLGTTLRDFVCFDELGKTWVAAELDPGKRVTLTRSTSVVGAVVVGGSRRFTELWDASAPKTAGRWRAHGGETDLAPIATLDTVRWKDSDVLFAGVIEAGGVEAKPEGKR